MPADSASPVAGWLEKLAAQAQAGRDMITSAGVMPSLRASVPQTPMPAPMIPATDSLLQDVAAAQTRANPQPRFAVAGGVSDAGGVNPEFSQRLHALVAASGGRLSIGNDYRSTARQAQLFAAAVKKYGSIAAARKWVAPPGHSQHNRGLAADLKGDLNLAHQLAGQFGLYFPMGHEPWHVELRGSRG